jgi:L-malate glycosyltransferase
MRILIISLMEGFPWGGSEELWYRVANHALSLNHEVHVTVKKWDFVPDKVQELIKKGTKVHFRENEVTPHKIRLLRKIFKNFGEQKNKWEIILENQFDHLLISFGGAYTILGHQDLIAMLSETKVSYSIIQQYNTENSFLYDSLRNQGREVFKNAQNVFFVCRRNQETTERNLVCKFNNARIISNPANLTNTEKHIPFPDIEKTLSFASVARFDVEIKNQDFLIEAFSDDKWKNRNFSLNFYGQGPGENYLKELITLYGLEDKVNIHGHINDISVVWERNHVLLLPSSSEGSPLTIIEAMYCSRPVMATDVGGNAELIDEQSGFLVSGVTLRTISNTLDRIWNNKVELEKMGLNARKRIITIHNNTSHSDILNVIIGNK